MNNLIQNVIHLWKVSFYSFIFFILCYFLLSSFYFLIFFQSFYLLTNSLTHLLEITSFNDKVTELVKVLEAHAARIDEQKLRVNKISTRFIYFLLLFIYLMLLGNWITYGV